MIGKKVSHYKILEEIGAGGMGIVYKAEDSKLNRTVALKFVVPRIVRRQEDRERFVREAQTAAALNHPNICTIHEIDEVEENLFIAMEYVEGQSLKNITEKGPLKIEKVLDIGVQIADGIQEAHDAGIVHRDIKSSNIMLTKKGQAKIMDFGLAKPLEESKLTETATIMGTIAYMSPEQASGEAFDHRTDIWSFGVVLYEMLSGQLPFGGEHQQLVLYAILNQNPQPLKDLPYEIPFGLDGIIFKCLEKDPNERYQRADELLEDLRQLKRETESGIVPSVKAPKRKTRRTRIQPLKTLWILVLMALVLVVGYLVLDLLKQPTRWKNSIAVLPFDDQSPQNDRKYLCVGIPRAIIQRLSRLSSELRVASYFSIEKYINSDENLAMIGKELDVENLLISRLEIVDESIRIYAELIDIKENRLIRSFDYSSEDEELLDFQDRISRDIVKGLGVYFDEAALSATRQLESNNPEAYDYYLRGMNILDEKDTDRDPEVWFTNASRMFNRAISIDPNYSRAYWGLGAAHEALYVRNKNRTDLDLMFFNFEKAYDLSPELAEANLGLGWAYFYKEDLDKAYQSFKKALELDPDSFLINCDIGSFFASIGLFHHANEFYSKAIQLEPSYIRAYLHSTLCHWYVGEFEEGARIVEKIIEAEKYNPEIHVGYARHLIMMKKNDQAEEELAEAEKINPDFSSIKFYRALLFAVKKEREKALELLVNEGRTYVYPATALYSILGMKDKAIENIKIGIDLGFEKEQRYLYSYPLLLKHPAYENLRDDPRFQEILRKEKEKYDQKIKKYGNI